MLELVIKYTTINNKYARGFLGLCLIIVYVMSMKALLLKESNSIPFKSASLINSCSHQISQILLLHILLVLHLLLCFLAEPLNSVLEPVLSYVVLIHAVIFP